MEKVRSWCGQPSDQGRLKIRSDQMGWISGLKSDPHSSPDVTKKPCQHDIINQAISQSINIRLLRRGKMQANNSKQKGNTVSKKKAGLENKPENWA